MKVSPISQNQYNSKNPSFNAVNQKYLQKAINEYNRRYPYPNQSHLITMLKLEIAYKRISVQDGIDTLNALKLYDPNNIEDIEADILDLKKTLGQTNK